MSADGGGGGRRCNAKDQGSEGVVGDLSGRAGGTGRGIDRSSRTVEELLDMSRVRCHAGRNAIAAPSLR